MIPVYHPFAQVSPIVEDALCKAWTAMARAEGHRPAPAATTTDNTRLRYARTSTRAEAIIDELAKGHATSVEIAEALGITSNATRICLSGLSAMGRVRNVTGKKSHIVWGLAPKGRCA